MELTKLLNESSVDLQQETPVETDARTDSGQAEWGLRPLPAHAHGPLQWYDGPWGRNSGDISFPRPPVGHVGDERLARRREFARVHRLMDS